MEAARANWTDSRLDDLKETVVGIDEKVTRLDRKVDAGFGRLDGKIDRLDRKFDEGYARLDGKMEEGFARLDGKIEEGYARLDRKMEGGYARLDGKIDAGLGRIDDRIDMLHHALVHGMIALISIIAVLLAAFLTVVVTQL